MAAVTESLTRLTLQEYGRSEPLALEPDQLAALLAVNQSALRVEPSFRPGRFHLKVSAMVGEIAVPRLRISIVPKVDAVEGLLFMLTTTGRLPDWSKGAPDLHACTGPLDLLVWLFTDQVERLVTQGLHRAYQQEQDNLLYLRGRLTVPEQMRQNLVYRHRMACEYAEHTLDVAENQALRAVISRVVNLPLSIRAVRPRLRRLLGAFDSVAERPFSGSALRRIRLTRLTERYRRALAAGALLLDGLSAEQGGPGPAPFQSFLLDMNTLYEEYVTAVLNRLLGAKGYLVTAQGPTYLDAEQLVRIVPDLQIRTGRGQPLLVADLKYKVAPGGMPLEADLYQVLAYGRALGIKRAALIYADAEPRRLVVPDHAGGYTTVDVLRFGIQGGAAALRTQGDQLAGTLLRLLNEHAIHAG